MINHDKINTIADAKQLINELEQKIIDMAESANPFTSDQNLPKSISDKNPSLRDILTLVPGILFWKNRNGYYLGCNHNLAKLLKLNSPDEIIGKHNNDLFDADSAAKLDHADEEVMRSGKERQLEETGHNQFGEPAIYFTQKSPLFNKQGEVIGLLGISIDITERKRIEKELLIAKEKAESSNRAKSQFLAVVNHELRTPLTGILGLANELKKKQSVGANLDQTIENLTNCTDYLLTLINDILDFTKLEAGKIAPSAHPINVTELIGEINNVLSGIAKGKNLELITHIDSDLPCIASDARAIRQILINIISNAIKFTEQGHVEIKVTASERTSSRARLNITVNDTGPGIPQDKIQQIFEPFKQLEDTYLRQSSRSGTGLGLAIVKRLCDVIDMTIDVDSIVGKGTTFILSGEFDLAPTAYQVAEPKAKSQDNSYKTSHPVRALLIEDDIIVQHIHKSLLEELGCQVDVSAYGQEALQTYADHDIVFVDIGLSDITGFEVIKRLRQQHHATHIPVIALTGYTGEEERQACMNAGADEVATKPISSTHLLSILKRHLYK